MSPEWPHRCGIRRQSTTWVPDFTEGSGHVAALTAIAQTVHGLPRRINQIAHNALAAAAAGKGREVTDHHVAQALDELNLKA